MTPPNLALTCRYGTASIEIAGSTAALHELVRLLRESHAVSAIPLLSPASSPSPYDGYLTMLRIVPSGGKVRISRNVDEVTISGSQPALSSLSNSVAFLARESVRGEGERRGSHLHVEYYPGHFFLREDSTPVVLSALPDSC